MKKNGAGHPETSERSWPAAGLNGCQHQREAAAATGSNGESEGVRKIEQTIAFMQEHLDQPLQVATLAARASVSPSHFFALFKRRTGSPPIVYFIRLRMERARELLEASSLHVKEVAAALGYDDPFYFSRVFKSVNRVAPSDYRAARRERPDRHTAGSRECSRFSQKPI